MRVLSVYPALLVAGAIIVAPVVSSPGERRLQDPHETIEVLTLEFPVPVLAPKERVPMSGPPEVFRFLGLDDMGRPVPEADGIICCSQIYGCVWNVRECRQPRFQPTAIQIRRLTRHWS